MPCQRVTLPGGFSAIVCGPKPRLPKCACGKPAPQLCDWKVPEHPNGTCSKPICKACTHVPAPGKDLCPEHAAIWKARIP